MAAPNCLACDPDKVKPGSRPNYGRKGWNWCGWRKALEKWTPDQLQEAWDKADKAQRSKASRAQYAGWGEMREIQEVRDGKNRHYCRCQCHRVPSG